ncbi:hypothetical protein LTR84_011748 [Exophiala bonariae]|uniref:Uncharacterized protein n=1 Tax=Exophiala bonariae TaxID=1690606 RepID=A0AAV9NHB1_9EURO|nr:hypothetical protein LTR84_011748 [Exophiala bonariae]
MPSRAAKATISGRLTWQTPVMAQRRSFSTRPLQASSAQAAQTPTNDAEASLMTGSPITSTTGTTPASTASTESGVLYANITDTPPRIVGSQGMYLYTEDGREILDATGGAAVVSIGHNHPRVKSAIMRQLDQVAYSWAPLFTTHAAEKLADVLVESTGGHMSKVFVVSSGTEAVEAALKIARQYFLELPEKQPKRTRFIARRQSYHGNTLGSLSVGGHVARKQIYNPILSTNTSHVSPCYAYRGKKDAETDEEYVSRLAQEIDDEFQAVGPDTVCAFIAETVAGTTLGSVPATPGYFQAMKEVCDRHGALFILDEVMSGMGRTGTLHAWEQEGVIPDLQTVAKGLGAGYASVGALLINKRVVESLRQGTGIFSHSQTYQAHPVACAAALEVQQVIRDENLLQNAREMGAYLEKTLKERIGYHKNVGDIRGRGLFWGVEFVSDKPTKEPFPAERKIGPLLSKTAVAQYSLSLIPMTGMADGFSGDGVQLAPPYNVTRAQIDTLVDRLDKVIRQVLD